MNPADLGFSPALAGHAAASVPVFVGAMAVAKRLEIVSPRFELLVAAAVTSLVNVGGSLASGQPLLPALSAGVTGALVAMVGHAVLTKGKDA